MTKRFELLFFASFGLMIAGCGLSEPASSASNNAPSTTTEAPAPNQLNFAFVPSDDAEQMAQGLEKIRGFVEKKLGIPVKLSKVTSYAACVEAMKKKRVDVAWFGPASYIVAEQEANAEAFDVAQDSKGVSTYVSEILVPSSSTAKTLEDLKGKTVAFVEASSTSGGLVPSYLIMKATQMPAEKFCKVSYAGNHDAVASLVQHGSVDAGATNNLTIERLIEQGKLKTTEFRVLVKSDPIPGSPLAWRKDLPDSFKQKIRDAFESSPKTLGTYKVAGLGEIATFRKVTPDDYSVIRDMAKKLDVQRDTLLK